MESSGFREREWENGAPAIKTNYTLSNGEHWELDVYRCGENSRWKEGYEAVWKNQVKFPRIRHMVCVCVARGG